MAYFKLYAPLLHELEKGFTDDPDDRGGPTKDGVTLSTFRKFYGEEMTVEDLKNMTWAQWCHIMKTGYWDVCRASEINNQSLAEIIVDWCVNSGAGALREVQTIAGVKPDGIIGPKTLAALNGPDQEMLFNRVRLGREQWFRKIVQKRPSQQKYWAGWMNRLAAFTFNE